MDDLTIPWYWCEIHDADLAGCGCGDRPVLPMRHITWPPIRVPQARPVDDVDTGGRT